MESTLQNAEQVQMDRPTRAQGVRVNLEENAPAQSEIIKVPSTTGIPWIRNRSIKSKFNFSKIILLCGQKDERMIRLLCCSANDMSRDVD